MFTLELQGLEALERQWQQLAAQAQQALTQALQQEAEHVLESSLPDVPIDTGLMVSSGMVETKPDGADIRFGGHGLAPYTIRQHEDVTLNHPNGGTHHWLSKALFAATGTMPQRLAADLVPRLRR